MIFNNESQGVEILKYNYTDDIILKHNNIPYNSELYKFTSNDSDLKILHMHIMLLSDNCSDVTSNEFINKLSDIVDDIDKILDSNMFEFDMNDKIDFFKLYKEIEKLN